MFGLGHMFILINGDEGSALPQGHVPRGSGLRLAGGHISGSYRKGGFHIDSKWFWRCVALSVAGSWETEMGVLQAFRWQVPCLSPHSAPSPAWPVRYKYSRLSASLLSSPPCITKGLQMVRLSGSLPHKPVGFVSPFSLPTCICRSGRLGSCFRP